MTVRLSGPATSLLPLKASHVLRIRTCHLSASSQGFSCIIVSKATDVLRIVSVHVIVRLSGPATSLLLLKASHTIIVPKATDVLRIVCVLHVIVRLSGPATSLLPLKASHVLRIRTCHLSASSQGFSCIIVSKATDVLRIVGVHVIVRLSGPATSLLLLKAL